MLECEQILNVETLNTRHEGKRGQGDQEPDPSSTHSDDVEISRKGSHWGVVRLISWRLLFLFSPVILVHTLVN
jgi:hypothetical protein